MKKMMALTACAFALIALVVAPATSFAGSCGSHDQAAAKTTEAKMASAHCTAQDAAACAARMGMTIEECQTLCAAEGTRFVSLSIEGMTCGGCEKTISACLEEIPGVLKVGKVNYKDGTAFALIDSKQVKGSFLANAVTKKGYKAEVIPAVATVDGAATKMVGDKAGCTAGAHKSCAKTCTKPCTGKDKADAKTEKPKESDGTM